MLNTLASSTTSTSIRKKNKKNVDVGLITISDIQTPSFTDNIGQNYSIKIQKQTRTNDYYVEDPNNEVYQIINNHPLPLNADTHSNDACGNFLVTFDVSENEIMLLSYIIAGGGGGGSVGNWGGGGGSSGELNYGVFPIEPGTYRFNVSIGGGGHGGEAVTTYLIPINDTYQYCKHGWGGVGGTTRLEIINVNTLETVFTQECIGGSPGECTNNRNNTFASSSGAYGGGSGPFVYGFSQPLYTTAQSFANTVECIGGTGLKLTINGSPSFGGDSSLGSSTTTVIRHSGSSGGASAKAITNQFGRFASVGCAANTSTSDIANKVSGGPSIGGEPTSNLDIGITNFSFKNKQSFCEGGHGSYAIYDLLSSTVNSVPILTPFLSKRDGGALFIPTVYGSSLSNYSGNIYLSSSDVQTFLNPNSTTAALFTQTVYRPINPNNNSFANFGYDTYMYDTLGGQSPGIIACVSFNDHTDDVRCKPHKNHTGSGGCGSLYNLGVLGSTCNNTFFYNENPAGVTTRSTFETNCRAASGTNGVVLLSFKKLINDPSLEYLYYGEFETFTNVNGSFTNNLLFKTSGNLILNLNETKTINYYLVGGGGGGGGGMLRSTRAAGNGGNGGQIQTGSFVLNSGRHVFSIVVGTAGNGAPFGINSNVGQTVALRSPNGSPGGNSCIYGKNQSIIAFGGIGGNGAFLINTADNVPNVTVSNSARGGVGIRGTFTAGTISNGGAISITSPNGQTYGFGGGGGANVHWPGNSIGSLTVSSGGYAQNTTYLGARGGTALDPTSTVTSTNDSPAESAELFTENFLGTLITRPKSDVWRGQDAFVYGGGGGGGCGINAGITSDTGARDIFPELRGGNGFQGCVMLWW